MEEGSKLQAVTLRLLTQVEAVLEEGNADLSELKQVAAILKDVKEIRKDTAAKEESEDSIRVVLEGEVAHYGG
jgi:hypothetical protein